MTFGSPPVIGPSAVVDPPSVDRIRGCKFCAMKVLVFTTLYPNNVWPNHGVFIKERMTQFAKHEKCEIRVIAPVPYFPAINFNWRWQFSQVAPREMRDGVEVYHPRYLLTPKV